MWGFSSYLGGKRFWTLERSGGGSLYELSMSIYGLVLSKNQEFDSTKCRQHQRTFSPPDLRGVANFGPGGTFANK